MRHSLVRTLMVVVTDIRKASGRFVWRLSPAIDRCSLDVSNPELWPQDSSVDAAAGEKPVWHKEGLTACISICQDGQSVHGRLLIMWSEGTLEKRGI